MTWQSASSGSRWAGPSPKPTWSSSPALSGDFNPIHMDHEFARSTPFRRPIAHGLLVFSVASGLTLDCPPMRTLAFLEIREWHFRDPVFFGDTIRVAARWCGRNRGPRPARRDHLAAADSQPGRQGRAGRPGRHPGRGRGGNRRHAVEADTGRRGRTDMKEFQLFGLGNALSTSSSRCPTTSSPRSASSAAPRGWSIRPNRRPCWSGFAASRPAPGQRRLGGQLRHRFFAAGRRRRLPRLRRRRPLRPLLRNRVRGAGHRHRQHGPRRRNDRHLRLHHHAGRRAHHAHVAGRAPAGWRRSTWTRNGSRTRNGCSSKATASPTRDDAGGHPRPPCAVGPQARRQGRRHLLGGVHRQRLPRCLFRRARSRPTCCSATRPRPAPSPGATAAEAAFARLKELVPSAVVTDGANGAYVRHGGVEAHVPAFPCGRWT